MSDISQVRIGSTTYDLKDAAGRGLLASEYDPASTYKAGALVTQSDLLYRAKGDITAESWTAAHWEQIPVGAVLAGMSEASPNIFRLGTVAKNKGVEVAADEDGSLITFGGTSSNPPVTIPLFGESDYNESLLPAGTYFFGEEQVTGEVRLNLRVGNTTVSNQVYTIDEPTRCYLRFGTNHISFANCSARYWIIKIDHPVGFIPHAPGAVDRLARLAVESAAIQAAGNLAAVETANASANHVEGELLTVGGRLYKAAQNIESGATLTPGDNITETTIADELNAIRALITT